MKNEQIEIKKIKKLPAFLENKKAFNAVLIGGLVLILLIFFGDLLFSSKKESKAQNSVTDSQSIEQIEKKLEEKLLTVLQKIDGIGQTSIMLTIESGTEYVFAEQGKSKNSQNNAFADSNLTSSQSSNENEISYIIVEGVSGRKEALVKTIIQPKIRGVIIHCENGDNPYIKEKVVDAVSKVFGISTARISVIA